MRIRCSVSPHTRTSLPPPVDDLFASAASAAPGTPPVPPGAPLAERLRPGTIDAVVGQQHLLAPGKPLAVAFAARRLHSMILWGPPGVGKTTLARLMAAAFDAEFIALSAVLSGVKDIRDAVARAQATRAQSGRATILFVDEVHRFNKAQQDAFLPYVESGLLTLVGATTENPSFEVNSALLSRASVYVLNPLSADEMGQLFERACARALHDLSFDDDARSRLIGLADPRALTLALEAWDTYERLGSPEGELALAQCAIYLAIAAKSNAGYMAFNRVKDDVAAHGTLDVPLHLRNAPTKLMKSLGYGKEYQYDHDAEGGIALDQQCLPDELAGTRYYEPVARGLEIQIKDKLDPLRDARDAARKGRKK